MILCNYGCGKEGIFYLKFVKKWCCSKSSNGCSKVKERKKNSVVKINELQICSYGCNKVANYKLSNGKFCCENYYRNCSQFKLEFSESKKGDKNPCKGHTEENKKRWREQRRGKNNPMFGKKHSEETKKKIGITSKERMLKGLASYCNKFIQNPSKPQVEIYDRVKELYPSAILNFPIMELNYSLDIAIPELKIWIESDGSYWHQDKEKDLERQKKIENLGWKCIRYLANSILDVPDVEKIKIDINRIKLEKGDLNELG